MELSRFRAIQICAPLILLLQAAPGSARPRNDSGPPTDQSAEGIARNPRFDESTTSPEAARRIQSALAKMGNGSYPEALALTKEAQAIDAHALFPCYLEARILENQGSLAQSAAVARRCFTIDSTAKEAPVLCALEYRLGLILAPLGSFDESNHWLSRAIIDGDQNLFDHELPTIYATMARNLRSKKEIGSAILTEVMTIATDSNRDASSVFNDSFSRDEREEGEQEDVARALFVDESAPEIPARAVQASTRVTSSEDFEAGVTRLLSDREGKTFIVLGKGLSGFGVLRLSPAPSLSWVKVGHPILAGSFSEGHLFVIVKQSRWANALLEIDPNDGIERRSWALNRFNPSSLVVLYNHRIALFPERGLLYSLNLDDRRLVALRLPADDIAADALETHVYTTMRQVSRGKQASKTILVDGVPVTMKQPAEKHTQTLLFQVYLTKDRVLMSQARDHAAADASEIVASPDGRWVALPGKGGWHPRSEDGGPVLPVYSAGDLHHVQARVEVGGVAKGGCFNPVTNQAAIVREHDADIVYLGTGKVETVLHGAFSGPCAWTGDGKHLLLAAGSKVTIAENALGEAETEISPHWWQKPTAPDGSHPLATAVPGLEMFKLTDDPAIARPQILRRLRAAREGQLQSWDKLDEYAKDEESYKATQAVLTDKGAVSPGIRIYRLQKLFEKKTSYAPSTFFLAQALAAAGQEGKSQALFLNVVQLDAGRTDLSTQSLEAMATSLADNGRKIAATLALATSWSLARGRGNVYGRLTELLSSLGYLEEISVLKGMVLVEDVKPDDSSLPPLPVPAENGAVISAAEVFQRVAPSVLLVKTEDGFGSGFCIGESGLIATSNHVIEGARNISIDQFVVDHGAVKRVRTLQAHIAATRKSQDLALLRVDGAAPDLRPLPVAATSPGGGTKIYAIGNPGLGHQSLDMTISEGIVSAKDRLVEGKKYIQHTAAVNPGNSGGPLVNDRGEVVGVVSMVAFLNNVAFATPVEELRQIFPQHGAAPAPQASADAGVPLVATVSAPGPATDSTPTVAPAPAPPDSDSPSLLQSAQATAKDFVQQAQSSLPDGCSCGPGGQSAQAVAFLVALFVRRRRRPRAE